MEAPVRVRVVESTVWRAPLGLRFRDLATGSPVTDGLMVVADGLGGDPSGVAIGRAGVRREALRSPVSGVYGFRALPGLRRFEGEEPAAAWCGSPPDLGSPPGGDLGDLLAGVGPGGPPNFVVSVVDRATRFLPQTLLMCLPKERLVEAPLFSAPARPRPGGLAAVRGELWDRAGNAPAGWALVVVDAGDGTDYVALADARGVFVTFVPYAGVLPQLVGSPPAGGGPLEGLIWQLTVRVFWQPARLRWAPGAAAEDPPDTRSILEQAPATVYDTPAASGPEVVRPLQLGRDVVVATADRSRLLVDPA